MLSLMAKHCINERMITVPANRRIEIIIPDEIPAGETVSLKLFWPPDNSHDCSLSGRASVSKYAGTIPAEVYGNGLVYQRRLRDEWND